MSKYSIEAVLTCYNDESGKPVFTVGGDEDGLGLIHIETPMGDLKAEEAELLISAIQTKIELNKKFMSK